MSNNTVCPEDIIPDGADYTQINGVSVRKGTVAAFIANIDLLENPDSCLDTRKQALIALKELAPFIITIGLDQHVIFKNTQIQDILAESRVS
ncbi:hypothetical protein [Legionella fairfieldensis]|uniref:hypothetical protein n=1 Tax=Legionella fairfieldensis TaxID=45064 RepID=UPI00049217C9|nr:hypothetical protein [Legionella fairfieldensis]